jgi:hypothetical protein
MHDPTPTFIDRLAEEHNQLEDRLAWLTGYFERTTFAMLPVTDQYLLKAQYSAMAAYELILQLRLKRLALPYDLKEAQRQLDQMERRVEDVCDVIEDGPRIPSLTESLDHAYRKATSP